MPAVMLALVIVASAIGMWVIVSEVRRRRTPLELRGDWWERFERDFRAYAARKAAPPRPDRRRQKGEPA
jgi:hypothetical protein